MEPIAIRAGCLDTQSPTRFQKPCVSSAKCSCRKRRTSYGLKIARSSGPKISEGTRPRVIHVRSAFRSTIGSRMSTTRHAPITGRSACRREPSTMRRRSLPEVTPSGAIQAVECGTNGQKARRPKIVSSAGSRVSIESAAHATPIAAIGPIPDVPLTFAIIRQKSAAITVAADASTAGPAELIAAAIASCRSNRWCSSSR